MCLHVSCARHLETSYGVVNAALLEWEYVIVLMDADGQQLDLKTNAIKQYLDPRYADRIRIVLLDYEIEEWICYSLGIKIHAEKPSTILKRNIKYKKNRLPTFALRLDCTKLAACSSFQRLVQATKSF